MRTGRRRKIERREHACARTLDEARNELHFLKWHIVTWTAMFLMGNSHVSQLADCTRHIFLVDTVSLAALVQSGCARYR